MAALVKAGGVFTDCLGMSALKFVSLSKQLQKLTTELAFDLVVYYYETLKCGNLGEQKTGHGDNLICQHAHMLPCLRPQKKVYVTLECHTSATCAGDRTFI